MKKKKSRYGCFLALLLPVGVLLLFLTGIFSDVEKSAEPFSRPPENALSSVPSAEPSAEPSQKIPSRADIAFVHPFRLWEDAAGQKMKARFLERRGEKVVLRVGRAKRTFLYADFSERDRRFLDALETFPETNISLKPFPARTWTPWDLPSFEARLLDASPVWILLERGGKRELYSLDDFSVPDWEYLREIGWNKKVKIFVEE